MKKSHTVYLLFFFVSLASLHAKTALVTGGAGFLGSHMCEKLVEEGYRVICLDNLYSGNLENISSLKDHPYFSFIEHDIEIPFKTSEEIDLIYNFACPASPVFYQKDPLKTLKTNVIGSINLLELAHQKNATIFQASTSEIYGDPLEHPQSESYFGNVNPIGIRACYDEGKRAAESLFFDYHRIHFVKIKVARIFNTYGPRMRLDDGRVVSNFLVQALQDLPITLYGDGSQTRSFCYVSDLIDAIYQFTISDSSITGPINLGNPGEYSMQELAKEILLLTGSKSPLVFMPLPLDDPKKRKPNIDLAKALLRWQPQVELKEGLEKTCAYFKEKLGKQ